ncbi:MAG: MotA/TolQ/ExbB proton channel family protein [Clostridia bacterium]|nr:MotA/TolQ/ExbB proton channel family protein [Clostridia bacterium]
MFADMIQNLAENMTDVLVYTATAVVFVIGMFKCVFPLRAQAHRLRRAIRVLETMPPQNGERPAWQDSVFLGKRMQNAWRRFLQNAEQLDARGLACNLDDYVNDETVIYSVGHIQLGEMIPSLLTSLGILGTFIGLIRGLGGLDVSDAAKTMESIPAMIGGMTFAFSTSIVGIACSLVFNVFNRMAIGSAVSAIDEFQEAFHDLVMQRPLDESVMMICQQRDRDAMLRRMSGEMANRVSGGMQEALERSLVPVTQQMTQFIMGQTQSQIDGVNMIAQQFVVQMNRSLGNQLVQLGETLSVLNQSQHVNYESLQGAMNAADHLMDGMAHLQRTTEEIMTRFESYIASVEETKRSNDEFLAHGAQVLNGLIAGNEEQSALLDKIRNHQRELQVDMRDYAEWSSRALQAVQGQSKDMTAVTQEMKKSADMLSGSYASFVQNIGSGLNKSVGLFDENVGSVMNVLNERLKVLKQAAELHQENEEKGLVEELSILQRTMTEISVQLKTIAEACKKEVANA